MVGTGMARAVCRLLTGWSRREVRPALDSVFITGCDSGIGLCWARHLAARGCVVFAGVHNRESAGAKLLASSTGKVHILEIDVTDQEKTSKCAETVSEALKGQNLELTAVVNNAAVMIFGEFEWQTQNQIEQQIGVNIIGYMRVAKAFLPLLRKHKGRLINVTSHCSQAALPCLGIYAATKAAVESWSFALSIEMHKFNVPVITVFPGSYPQESNILKNQSKFAEDMLKAMTPELRQKSKEYFDPLMSYMSAVSNPTPIQDNSLEDLIMRAIFSKSHKYSYANSPWRYTFYYSLINLAKPFWELRRRLVLAFIMLPKYK